MEKQPTKYGPIIKDALILMAFSSVFALICNYGFKALKGAGATTDPIIASIIQNDVPQIKKLIADKAGRIDVRDEQERTPLMWAAYVNLKNAEMVAKNEEKRVEVTGILIENNADPNLVDRDGWTALSWAAWTGFPRVAAALLDAGAAVDAADKRGNTPLMIAALRGNAPLVSLLLERGADKAAKNSDSKDAAALATEGTTQYPDRTAAYTEILSQLK